MVSKERGVCFMESKDKDAQGMDSAATVHNKMELKLPLIAFALSILPFILFCLHALTPALRGLTSLILLLLICSPMAGLILGIVSLSVGKGRIGLAGKILAGVAVAVPIACVALVVTFFVGVNTGLISLM